MTKPDEALLWARENMAKWCEENDEHQLAQTYRSGAEDIRLIDEVRGYRAGAAASADRIKELEARVAELEAALRDIAEGDVCVCDLRDARDRTLQSIALAALKEADQ